MNRLFYQKKKILLYNTIKFGTNNAIKLRLLQFAEDKNSNKLGLYACAPELKKIAAVQ